MPWIVISWITNLFLLSMITRLISR
jgi:hypothetical protein